MNFLLMGRKRIEFLVLENREEIVNDTCKNKTIICFKILFILNLDVKVHQRFSEYLIMRN